MKKVVLALLLIASSALPVRAVNEVETQRLLIGCNDALQKIVGYPVDLGSPASDFKFMRGGKGLVLRSDELSFKFSCRAKGKKFEIAFDKLGAGAFLRAENVRSRKQLEELLNHKH